MELQSTGQFFTPGSNRATEELIDASGLQPEVSSISSEVLVEVLPGETSSAPKQSVPAEDVQQLYRQFRKAALESTARELRKQQAQRIQGQVEILNIPIDNISVSDFLSQLKQGVVFTPNVDHLMKLQKDVDFVKAYSKADYRVCDSQVLMFASKFLGTPIKAKISGSDLFPMFCEHHRHNEAIKIFLMGGAEGVADQALARINARIGREIVVQAHSPSFGFEKDEAECDRILEMIRQSPANVLVVGVGAPKQEKWIAKYRDHLPNIDIFLAVGAAIDFEAGNKPRAPQLISDLGLEWLYRLSTEPGRLWKRYLLDDFPFLWLVGRERLARLLRKPAAEDTYK
ncbi:WecB/TagA/CpsF family glycosyltransferase [Nodosilinea sp. E11]|uniref:WecB/TagA/CpsF family glycosyltransferase n=1 Tax=Nodosilinea sp. E11 TaxID=3037479 RepID=UPI002934E0AB|nr:WecB/TagA/CpsF family glycosyltransferase [Nodosilinea sp. E11]WOD38734.1 WecB/TagA/CpsF family glycosyltransferase [Nodosilinea sp. E11]